MSYNICSSRRRETSQALRGKAARPARLNSSLGHAMMERPISLTHGVNLPINLTRGVGASRLVARRLVR